MKFHQFGSLCKQFCCCWKIIIDMKSYSDKVVSEYFLSFPSEEHYISILEQRSTNFLQHDNFLQQKKLFLKSFHSFSYYHDNFFRPIFSSEIKEKYFVYETNKQCRQNYSCEVRIRKVMCSTRSAPIHPHFIHPFPGTTEPNSAGDVRCFIDFSVMNANPKFQV